MCTELQGIFWEKKCFKKKPPHFKLACCGQTCLGAKGQLKKMSCLVLIDSCLGHSEQGLNGNCKHHYYFQKTQITSPILQKCGPLCFSKQNQTNDPFNCFDTSYTHSFKVPWQLLWFLVAGLQLFFDERGTQNVPEPQNTDTYWSEIGAVTISNDKS